MADNARQNDPSVLVAVWPGMGQVAVSAGTYLVSALNLQEGHAFPAQDLFDPEHVDVRRGIVARPEAPQGRMFVRRNAEGSVELAVFVGEAQPHPGSGAAFCERLLDAAQALGVREICTFASMATDMDPSGPSRVVGVATDEGGLRRLGEHGVPILGQGRISGLNGVFLAAAGARGVRGIGLLGEIPAMAAQIPYPKAARTVLEAFSAVFGINVDLAELIRLERNVDRQLAGLVSQLKQVIEPASEESAPEAEAEPSPPEPDSGPSPAERRRIEELFRQARSDRGRAPELKEELDRLDAFKEYENRFLDLFGPSV